MSNASGVTFQIKQIDSIEIAVELSIPPNGPNRMQGVIKVDCFPRSKEEFKQLADEQLDDVEYFDRIVSGVRGLGKEVNGTMVLLEGQDAIDEVKNGKWSMYFLSAIINAYFEQYGEARRKNSKNSSKR